VPGVLRSVVTRGGLTVVLVLVSQWILEWYPISHFPMYSRFGSRSHYVYVTDENDEPLPVERDFSVRAAYLKKVYGRNFGRFHGNKKLAATTTLEFVAERKKPSVTAKQLKLKQVSIKLKKGELQQTTDELGSVDL